MSQTLEEDGKDYLSMCAIMLLLGDIAKENLSPNQLSLLEQASNISTNEAKRYEQKLMARAAAVQDSATQQEVDELLDRPFADHTPSPPLSIIEGGEIGDVGEVSDGGAEGADSEEGEEGEEGEDGDEGEEGEDGEDGEDGNGSNRSESEETGEDERQPTITPACEQDPLLKCLLDRNPQISLGTWVVDRTAFLWNFVDIITRKIMSTELIVHIPTCFQQLFAVLNGLMVANEANHGAKKSTPKIPKLFQPATPTTPNHMENDEEDAIIADAKKERFGKLKQHFATIIRDKKLKKPSDKWDACFSIPSNTQQLIKLLQLITSGILFCQRIKVQDFFDEPSLEKANKLAGANVATMNMMEFIVVFLTTSDGLTSAELLKHQLKVQLILLLPSFAIHRQDDKGLGEKQKAWAQVSDIDFKGLSLEVATTFDWTNCCYNNNHGKRNRMDPLKMLAIVLLYPYLQEMMQKVDEATSLPMLPSILHASKSLLLSALDSCDLLNFQTWLTLLFSDDDVDEHTIKENLKLFRSELVKKKRHNARWKKSLLFVKKEDETTSKKFAQILKALRFFAEE